MPVQMQQLEPPVGTIFPCEPAEDSCSYVPLRRIDCDAFFRGLEQNLSSSRPQASEASENVVYGFQNS